MPQKLTLFSQLYQVGHRDLEEILRDIDLNGDGHVDFEGKIANMYLHAHMKTQYNITCICYDLDLHFVVVFKNCVFIYTQRCIYLK